MCEIPSAVSCQHTAFTYRHELEGRCPTTDGAIRTRNTSSRISPAPVGAGRGRSGRNGGSTGPYHLFTCGRLRTRVTSTACGGSDAVAAGRSVMPGVDASHGLRGANWSDPEAVGYPAGASHCGPFVHCGVTNTMSHLEA